MPCFVQVAWLVLAPQERSSDMIAHITESCVCEANRTRAVPGIEPGTSRTLSENHATRPNGLARCELPVCNGGVSTRLRRRAAPNRPSEQVKRPGTWRIWHRFCSWGFVAGILAGSYFALLLSARCRFGTGDRSSRDGVGLTLNCSCYCFGGTFVEYVCHLLS